MSVWVINLWHEAKSIGSVTFSVDRDWQQDKINFIAESKQTVKEKRGAKIDPFKYVSKVTMIKNVFDT